jgi:hypothetical protein
MRRFKELKKENARRCRSVSHPRVEKMILPEAAKGNL